MRPLFLVVISLLLFGFATTLSACHKHNAAVSGAGDSTAAASQPSDTLAGLFYFFGSNDDGSGTSCIMLNPDFTQRWRIDTLIGPELTLPAYGDGKIFVSGNLQVGANNPTQIAAFTTTVQAIDVMSGKTLWTHADQYLNAFTPFYFDGGVYAPDIERVEAFNDTTGQGSVIAAASFIDCSPYYWQDSSMLYMLNDGNNPYTTSWLTIAIDLTTRLELGYSDACPNPASFAFGSDKVIVSSQFGNLLALSKPTLEKLWENGNQVYSANPVLTDSLVFAFTQTSVFALDAETGAQVWQAAIPAPLLAPQGLY